MSASFPSTLDEQKVRRHKPSERLLAGAGVLAGGIGATLVAIFDPSKSNLYPVCPLFAATGLACPGCGLTRGFHSLFSGDFIGAMSFNLLTPFWAVIFGWVAVSLLLMALRGRGLPMWPTYPRVMWGFLVVLATFGILRNIPVWPLTFLFP